MTRKRCIMNIFFINFPVKRGEKKKEKEKEKEERR
jgi:hypothetical protein